MKQFLIIYIAFSFLSTTSIAQTATCDCKSDLDFLIQKMESMPSFKKQIKADKKALFEKTYNDLVNQMTEPISIEACYKLLLKQTLMVNDVHFSLQYKRDVVDLDNTSDMEAFKTSALYRAHPKTDRDVSELKHTLETQPMDAIEGIYTYGDAHKIGVYHDASSNQLIGVVLESALELFEPGDIQFTATPTNGNKYQLYYYKASTKTPSFVKSLSLENGRLWGFKKVGNTTNYEIPAKDQNDWEFKTIDSNTQYIYLGTFGNREKKKHKAFFKEVSNQLTADHVIVDLRSNRGGNEKFSDPYLKLLKNKNVYILTNCFTGSNGEQFTLKLRELKNSIHLGQTTRGIIAYGMNYGYEYTTPSGQFKITPTDMNFHKYIAYEGNGVTPEIALDFNSDWIEQTLEIISRKQ